MNAPEKLDEVHSKKETPQEDRHRQINKQTTKQTLLLKNEFFFRVREY